MSFPVAALWLNMNKVEAVQRNREHCFPFSYEYKGLMLSHSIHFQTKLDWEHVQF